MKQQVHHEPWHATCRLYYCCARCVARAACATAGIVCRMAASEGAQQYFCACMQLF
jgi:hypothetical protein